MHTLIYTYTCTPAYTHTHVHPHIHIHMHTRIHTHTNTYERGKCTGKEQTPTPASPLQRNSSYQSPPPKAHRQSTRRTNPNPHSLHRQTSLLTRVLSPPKRSTAPLHSLSHSITNLRFYLAPRHSRTYTRSLSHPFVN
jgi:hypothetical protein